MSTIHVREHKQNASGGYDIVHRETNASLVKIGDDENNTVESVLGELVEAHASLSESHASLSESMEQKANLVNGVIPVDELPALNKNMVGLGNVDNTRDLDKPISTAVQSSLDSLSSKLSETNANVSSAKSRANSAYSLAQQAYETADNAIYAAEHHTHIPADIGAATVSTFTATISSTTTSWTADGNYFYQNITIDDITESDDPIIGVLYGADNDANLIYDAAFDKVIHISTYSAGIQVWVKSIPTSDCPIKLKVVR